MTFKARIRGIYSTALTRKLLDAGFEIAQPSPTIQRRFRLPENVDAPHVDISDRHSRQGVHVTGSREPLRTVRTLLAQWAPDVVLREQPFPNDGVYKGIIEGARGDAPFVRVDLGSAAGKLLRSEVESHERAGIMVQIQRKPAFREPFLSTRISISGPYAVLIPEHTVKVSFKIRDPDERARLLALGERLAPMQGWGVIWRTSACGQPEAMLAAEVRALAATLEEVRTRGEEEHGPALLWGSQYYMHVEFPAMTKAICDAVRAQTTPTLEGHHYFKACGRRVSAALEEAEKQLGDGEDAAMVERGFRGEIQAEFPVRGSMIAIEHVKPTGQVLRLGPARIEAVKGANLCYSREVTTDGVYNALDVPKAAGDRAVTEARVGEWFYTTRYSSSDGVFKGALVNVHTPLELYPKWVRYVDLEVDVCVLPDGALHVVDEEALDDAVLQGLIGERLAVKARETVEEILQRLRQSIGVEKSE